MTARPLKKVLHNKERGYKMTTEQKIEKLFDLISELRNEDLMTKITTYDRTEIYLTDIYSILTSEKQYFI